MIATFTRLRIRSLAGLVRMIRLMGPIRKQLSGAEGLLHSEVKDFSTFTLWRDREAMQSFRNEGGHLEAMKRTRHIGTAESHTWECESPPTWREAKAAFLENKKKALPTDRQGL